MSIELFRRREADSQLRFGQHLWNAQALGRGSNTVHAVCLATCLIAVLISGCSQAPETKAPPSATEKAAAIINGGYTASQIEDLLRASMPKYDVVYSEEEANRWLSILVRLRKGSGVNEIDLLSCVDAMGGETNFTTAVALCAKGLD